MSAAVNSKTIENQRNPKAPADNSLRNQPALMDACQEIAALRELDSDWNDEGAPRIDQAAIQAAQEFIRKLAGSLRRVAITEQAAPAVFPCVNGGVQLHWKRGGQQKTLTFQPGGTVIEVITKRLHSPAVRREATLPEALEEARGAMRPAA